MKRTLIASLVAASIAAPAHAVPMAALDDMLSGILPGLDEAAIVIAQADFAKELRENLTTMYAPHMGSSRVVKGAPYTAEVVTESNQSLADGNLITRRTTGMVFRDGEGRTRQESGGDGKKRTTIYINDPVGGQHIVLVPDSKKAIVTPRISMTAAHDMAEKHAKERLKEGKEKRIMRIGPNEIRIEDGHVYLDGKEVTSGKVELNSGGKEIRVENGKVTIDGKEVPAGAPRVVVRTMDEKETGDGTKRQEIRVQVVRAGDHDVAAPLAPIPPMPHMDGTPLVVPPLPPMPGVETLRFESTSRLGKGATTQLGTRDFDGVRAEGKSTVWTIPAGEIGNRNPIQVTSETWYSPDLKVTVYSRYNDPRTGESIYRLANIRRTEPSKDLFAVPEGYETRGRGAKK